MFYNINRLLLIRILKRLEISKYTYYLYKYYLWRSAKGVGYLEVVVVVKLAVVINGGGGRYDAA